MPGFQPKEFFETAEGERGPGPGPVLTRPPQMAMPVAHRDRPAVARGGRVVRALYGLALLATRPRGVQPAPATPDLGPEPPAVASLLASGWDLTEDAAEATLLDLGARRFIEFRQPDDDPMHTTIHS